MEACRALRKSKVENLSGGGPVAEVVEGSNISAKEAVQPLEELASCQPSLAAGAALALACASKSKQTEKLGNLVLALLHIDHVAGNGLPAAKAGVLAKVVCQPSSYGFLAGSDVKPGESPGPRHPGAASPSATVQASTRYESTHRFIAMPRLTKMELHVESPPLDASEACTSHRHAGPCVLSHNSLRISLPPVPQARTNHARHTSQAAPCSFLPFAARYEEPS